MIGKKIEKLTVIKFVEKRKYRKYWLCKCDCGNEKIIYDGSLKSGNTKSCGCLRSISQKGKKHYNVPYEDLSNQRFGKLIALERIQESKKWLCKCDCGKITETITTRLKSGKTKSCGCLKNRKGKENPGYKNQMSYKDKNGYIVIRKKDHPNAGSRGLLSEHTYVMSEKLGRPLDPKETVHHKNGIRDDNRPDNLELWTSRHPKGQRIKDLIDFAHEILEQYQPLTTATG